LSGNQHKKRECEDGYVNKIEGRAINETSTTAQHKKLKMKHTKKTKKIQIK
jgi:hypothetical protein